MDARRKPLLNVSAQWINDLLHLCDLFFNLVRVECMQPLLVPGDLTDEETVKKTVEQTVAHFGRLDVLVNSAGILAMGGIETADLAQYDRVMNINVRWDFVQVSP